MPNHYHYLMRPEGEEDGLSKCIGYSFNSYSQALNKQRQWHGPLFQDRFKAVSIDRVDLLIHVCRYIHLNPVKAGLVGLPEAWPYSDYNDWTGKNTFKIKRINNYFQNGKTYKEFLSNPSADNQESQFIRYILE
jgi:putative transposase